MKFKSLTQIKNRMKVMASLIGIVTPCIIKARVCFLKIKELPNEYYEFPGLKLTSKNSLKAKIRHLSQFSDPFQKSQVVELHQKEC